MVDSMEMQRGLPAGVAAFVGRERERAKVADLVADTRVVTLTGTGGWTWRHGLPKGSAGWTCKG